MSIEFMVTTLIIVATPGTGALYVIAAGISRGARVSFIAAIGCTLGIVPHMAAAITGLAAVLHSSAVAFEVVKYAGVVYLLYMAWTTIHDRSDLSVSEASPNKVGQVIRSGILINILNPKLTIFFFAFLPQFVPAGTHDAHWRMALLSGVFMAVTLIVFAAYGVFAASVRDQVIPRPRVVLWMRRGFAATYAVLAARLALDTR
jgi:threonine/homoserine/homoserine lactone efflux protein